MTHNFIHEKSDDVLKELKNTFSTNESIDLVFNKFSITDIAQKIKALQACNASVATFYTPNYHDLTPEDQYIFERESFKHKTWEEVALYEKHGL